DERRLGETVTRIKRLATKTRAGERLLETIEGGRTHRFGPEECEVPTRQIQAFEALLAVAFYGSNAHLIGEIRPATGVGAIARDLLQPAQRVLEELQRRHDHALETGVHRLQHVADQAHVVLEREPTQRPR